MKFNHLSTVSQTCRDCAPKGIPSAETDWGRQGVGFLQQRKGNVSAFREGSSKVSYVMSFYCLVGCPQDRAWVSKSIRMVREQRV